VIFRTSKFFREFSNKGKMKEVKKRKTEVKNWKKPAAANRVLGATKLPKLMGQLVVSLRWAFDTKI